VGPPTSETRQKILESCQLDLCPSLTSASSLHEDLQDQATSVHDLQVENFLQVLDLARRQIVIEDGQIRSQLACGATHLLRFTSTDERSGVRCLALLQSPSGDLDAGTASQLGQLVEMLLDQPVRLPGKAEANQDGAPLIG
jgi:hypothetical protein